MNGNVEETIRRGYIRLNEYLDRYKGALSICGSGPSLKSCFNEITGDVMACNSAIGFLLERGIVPKFAMIWDASPVCENFAIPHKDITYLVGARCHPKVFERLAECFVIVWHAAGDHNILEFMESKRINEPLVMGGSTAITRGVFLGAALGYKDLHLFGADSCYAENGDTHVHGQSLVPEKDIEVWVGDGDGSIPFRTTPQWCAQVEEFKTMYPLFLNIGIEMTVHGEGMLAHVWRKIEGKRQELQIPNVVSQQEVSHAGV